MHKTSSVIIDDTVKDVETRLCSYEELPEWMQDNEYIRKFYRRPTFSYSKCIKSLGYLHNETGNIYSHGIGAGIFLALAGISVKILYQQTTTRWSDAFVLYLFIACAVACLTLSASFHMFSCHSAKVSYKTIFNQYNSHNHVN
jgi:adiponectin receptor